MINDLSRTDFPLETEVTIDGKTERFPSSPKTLRANIYVTLALGNVDKAVRERLTEALVAASGTSFLFQEGNLRVSAVPPHATHPAP